MRERPILFSAPMVRAILEGSKTQTRRVVKITHKTPGLAACLEPADPAWIRPSTAVELCSYGKTGDRLWVREPRWKVPEPSVKQLRDGADTWPKRFAYVADGDDPEVVRQWGWKWLPPMFMPRSASRILLEITDVRVQRLQEISEEDSIAEGADPIAEEVSSSPAIRYRAAFHSLWSSINGLSSWGANPWVWAITFKRIEAAERGAWS